MPGPFPGIDPYIERIGFWQEFHNSCICVLNGAINASLPERFVARTQVRACPDSLPTVFAVTRKLTGELPDEILLEERREAFIEILDRANGKQVVMVIELLSPENKRGEGREEYRRKQRAVLQSRTHLLELDLLRGGQHTAYAPDVPGDHAYLLSLADARRPWSAFVWRVGMRDALPALELPLTEDVDPFFLDLQAVFDRCYDEGRYAALLEDAYPDPVEPPLSETDATWARERLTLSAVD